MRNLCVILLPLAMACAPAATTGTTESPMPAPQPTAAAPATWRTGNYTATLAAADFPAGVPESARAQMAGTWEIQFHQGNHYVGMQNGRQVVEGPYRISGNQLMFSTGESGPGACNMPATYTWETTNGQTRFMPVGDDPCRGRAIALTTRPFTFSPG
jgi:hypothetical protein